MIFERINKIKQTLAENMYYKPVIIFYILALCFTVYYAHNYLKYSSVKIIELKNKPLEARIHHNMSTMCNGNVLITGGKNPKNGTPLNTTEIFDNMAQKFIQGPKMSLLHSHHNQFTLSNCDIVIIDDNGIETYNYKLNKFILWTKTRNKKDVFLNKYPFSSASIKMNNDNIILAGGYFKDLKNKAHADNKVRILDTKQKKIKQVLNMDIGRIEPGIAINNDNLYIFGGVDDNGKFLTSSIKISLKTGKITKIANLNHGRANFYPITLPDGILLAGGTEMLTWSAFDGTPKEDKYNLYFDLYDIKEDKFTTQFKPYMNIKSNLNNTNLNGSSLLILSYCELFKYDINKKHLKTLLNFNNRNFCHWENQMQFLNHNKILYTGVLKNKKASNAVIMEEK